MNKEKLNNCELGITTDDWIEIEFGDLCKFSQGVQVPKGKQYAESNTNRVRFLRIVDFTQGNEEPRYVEKPDDSNIVSKEDIAMVRYGTVGFVCTGKEGAIANNLFRVIPKIDIVNSYLINYLQSSLFKSHINSKGATMQALSFGLIRPIKVPLAPLPIQRAIISKIESLFSDLDNGIANLKKAQEQLKIYRQAVLKKAFEGELTKKWREEIVQTHGRASQRIETLPSAEELLIQIKEERQNHYNQQIEDWKNAVNEWEKNGKDGKKPSRISKPKEISTVQTSDIEDYESIPSEWLWSRFGNVTYKIGDIDHKMPKTVENGFPYLSTGNLKKDGSIDFINAKTVSKTDFERLALKIKPEKGDIIFPRYGTIGRNILIDFDKEFLVSYSCAIVKNITKLMSEKFALYYSLSPVIKKEIKKYTVETTQANIGIASIESFVFPLCSKKEQTQIVQEIESRLSVCDNLESVIRNSLLKAESLRQSILKKAFEGKLLSEAEIEACKQEEDYEQASVLLEKIKAEKVKTQNLASQQKAKKNAKK